MANIRPFRAYRYNLEKSNRLEDVIAPLFDVVTQDQREKLYELPHNAIHLSVPRSIQEANAKLLEWKQAKIITQDPLPAIYPYYQRFSLFGHSRAFERKGFICAVQLKTSENRSDIVLHENTLSHSVNDRIQLLEQTQLNIAPTHGLYEDAGFQIEPYLDEFMQCPILETIDYQNVVNKLGVIQHPEIIRKIQAFMANLPIYLADGHHRLEGSELVASRYFSRNPNASLQTPVNYHLMYLTNLRSDDVRILPTHRLLHLPEKISTNDLLAKLEHFFSISCLDSRSPALLEIQGQKATFILCTQGQYYKLQLKQDFLPPQKINLPIPDSLKELDYTRLHYFIFDQILEIPYLEQGKSPVIQYWKDSAGVISQVQEDTQKIGFLVNEVSMDEMLAVCNDHAKMPPKSTYFYPKVICGLVFYSIASEDYVAPFDFSF